MKLISHLSLFILLGIYGPLSGQADLSEGWNLNNDKDDIQVFTRKVEGEKIKQILIRTEVKGSMHALVRALEDVPTHGDWVFKCHSSRFGEKISDSEFYYYIKTDFPFPTSDRDLGIYYKRWQEEDGVVYTNSTCAVDAFPKEKKHVRISLFESYYRLERISDTKIAVEYFAKADPGGSIPKWIINLAITAGPTKTMKALKKQIQLAKYQKEIDGIID